MRLRDITEYLQSRGVITPGSDFWETYFPDYQKGDPGFYQIAIFNPPGGTPELGNSVDRPRFQLMVRAEDPDLAQEKCQIIFSELHGLNNITLGTHHYLLVKAIQTPGSIGKDDEGLEMVGCNFECLVENPTLLRS